MPLYEYRCRDCGERFEVLQRLGERGDDLRCPSCGQPAPERQLSTFASTGASRAGAGAGCGTRSGGFT